jgi:hypothetical protein
MKSTAPKIAYEIVHSRRYLQTHTCQTNRELCKKVLHNWCVSNPQRARLGAG